MRVRVQGAASITQVRVVQGKEPPHFCTVFKGRMVVYAGGGNGAEDTVGLHLFHVKGTTPHNTRAVEGACWPSAPGQRGGGKWWVALTPEVRRCVPPW
jgi:hypothetical protein